MRNRIRRVLRSIIAAKVLADERRCQDAESTTSVIEVEGVIEHVDPVGRELPVLVGRARVTFYVPLDCKITLNEELVRMRHLQPQDRARLVYSIEHGISTARAINVFCDESATVTAGTVPV